MSELVAALPMYDWPEVRAEVDAEWAAIRDRLRASGITAPGRLVRHNADLPAVPGGIRDRAGRVIAPDPADLPPDELDFATLWRHPRLLFAQTCWGPMEASGLAGDVQVLAQPSYDACEGGAGEFYSSAIVMRHGNGDRVASPVDGAARLPLHLLRGARLAFNEPHSMSGIIGLARDLAAMGKSLDIFSERVQTGGHRLSIAAVAEGGADVATIDCRSWALAQRFEPAAREVQVVGWTARRKGLPFICSRHLPGDITTVVRRTLDAAGQAAFEIAATAVQRPNSRASSG